MYSCKLLWHIQNFLIRSYTWQNKNKNKETRPALVLKQEEEQSLESYMIKMADYGHSLTTEELRLKVALLTQEKVTPFKDGIPGNSWFIWFKKRHPNLTTRQS